MPETLTGRPVIPPLVRGTLYLLDYEPTSALRPKSQAVASLLGSHFDQICSTQLGSIRITKFGVDPRAGTPRERSSCP